MYTTPWCGYCIRLKSMLAREAIAFTEVDIEQDPAAADVVMRV
ncbi:MAG: glutaredoxin family protein, partial [Acidimicrobiia bacterium]